MNQHLHHRLTFQTQINFSNPNQPLKPTASVSNDGTIAGMIAASRQNMARSAIKNRSRKIQRFALLEIEASYNEALPHKNQPALPVRYDVASQLSKSTFPS